ncbi:MAG: thioredoxin [Candidatus Scalindua sp.]|nr:thioredoxin [Candidatus Scalindua sp.]
MAGIVAAINSDFDQIVLESEMPVLVDFYADWCGPCKRQTPILIELSEIYDGKVKIVKVDIDVEENQALATKYGVMSVPTLIIFKNGEIKDTVVGVVSKSVLEKKIETVL